MILITLDEAHEKWVKYKKDKASWDELNKFNRWIKYKLGFMDFGFFCDNLKREGYTIYE